MKRNLKMAVTTYYSVEIDDSALVSLKTARELCGLSYSGLASAVDRGALTELVDLARAASRRDRRVLLRVEVLALAAQRYARAHNLDVAVAD